MMRLILLFLCFSLSLPLNANVNAKENDKPTTISPWLYKKLTKIESLISKKSYQQAEQMLKKLLPDIKKKSYEQATILRSLSSVYALKGQYKKSAETLSQAIALNVFPRKQEQQVMLNLGQLYMAIEQYAKAIKTLQPWLAKNPDPDAQISVLLANAYAQLKQYRKALPYIKKAIAQTQKPEESWYQLNLAIYYELKDYSSAAEILKKLINFYPDNKTYWHQLSSVYQQLNQYKKAVSTQHLAYKKGFITTEKDILELANLYLYIDSPYKAATLLQDSIKQKKIKNNSKNWEALANAWLISKESEHAIKALEMALNLKEKGLLYQQLGQIYVEQEKWKSAISTLNKAISKKGLKNIGATYLLLGMSYYELNNTKQAEKYFVKASQTRKNKKAARQWLKYIRETQKQGQ